MPLNIVPIFFEFETLSMIYFFLHFKAIEMYWRKFQLYNNFVSGSKSCGDFRFQTIYRTLRYREKRYVKKRLSCL